MNTPVMQRNRKPDFDMVGQCFDRLEIIKYVGRSKWLCKCECGEELLRDRKYLLKHKNHACRKCNGFNQWTQDQIKYMIDSYEGGKSTTKLAKEFNVEDATISSLLHKHIKLRTRGDSNRKYTLNYDAFAEMTPESSYWAGFLMADGNISYKANNHDVLFVELAIIDYEHLEKFRTFLGTDKEIYTRKRISYGKEREFCRLEISCKKILDDLNKNFGLTPNKSFTAKTTDQMILNRDFWRGMIEGDGWLCKKKLFTIGLIGALPIMQQYQKFLQHHFNKEFKIFPKETIYCVVTHDNTSKKLAKILYENTSLYLTRKYQIYMEKYA